MEKKKRKEEKVRSFLADETISTMATDATRNVLWGIPSPSDGAQGDLRYRVCCCVG